MKGGGDDAILQAAGAATGLEAYFESRSTELLLFFVVVFVCFEYISVHLFMSVQYCVCVVHRYNNVNHSLHCAVCATANMLL